MDRLILTRRERGPHGIFGDLLARGLRFFTGELDWHENKTGISCIPPGLYSLAWTWSPRFRRFVYLILPTAPRTGVRVHAANFMGDAPPYKKQLEGCLALGERLGWMDGQKALLLSTPAIRRFEAVMRGEPAILEVINSWA